MINKRRRKRLLVLTLLTLLIGLPAWTVYREYRQEHLNDALFAAVIRRDAQGVNRLLAQGADPNARETSRKSRSFGQMWRWVLESLRGHSSEQEREEPVLISATNAQCEDCVRALLKWGADTSSKDKFGQSAVECSEDNIMFLEESHGRGEDLALSHEQYEQEYKAKYEAALRVNVMIKQSEKDRASAKK